MYFPLPVSKNTHVCGLVIRKGDFCSYSIVWAGEFLKDDEEQICDKNVFILQQTEELEFVFCIWKSSEAEPRVLDPSLYYACFDEQKSRSVSNRYLFKVADKWLLLPYAPKDLFEKWQATETLDNADLSFFHGLFEKHAPKQFGERQQTRIARFCGWYNAVEDSPVDAYRRLFLETKTIDSGPRMDLSQNPAELSEQNRKKVKEAFQIVKCIFPQLIL